MRRWAEHLISQHNYKTAVIAFISLKQYMKAIQTLGKFHIERAVLFAGLCIKRQLICVEENKVILKEIFDMYSKTLENSGLDQLVTYYKQLFKISDN